MKLALIFLSVFLVAFSDQQFQQRRERLWWTPYNYAQQPFVNNYQESYYNVQDDTPDYRVFRPTRPVTYSQVPTMQWYMDGHTVKLVHLKLSLE